VKTQRSESGCSPETRRKSCVPLLAPFHMPPPSLAHSFPASFCRAFPPLGARARGKIWRGIALSLSRETKVLRTCFAKVKRGEAKRGEAFLALVF